jgi:hypothetical protein
MSKRLLTVFLLMIFSYLCSQAQQPPVLIAYGDTVGSTTVTLYIKFVPNDTGIVIAEVEMSQGTGNEIYDSAFTLGPFRSAMDTDSAVFYIGPVFACEVYQVLFNMNNDFPGNTGQGPLYNPLTTLTTLCNAGIETVNANNFHLIVLPDAVQLQSGDIPESAIVEIYDLTGRKVASASLNQLTQTIPLNANSGIYLLRVTGNSQTLYTTRFAHF